MLKQRILTAAVLLPLFVAALFYLPNLQWGLLLCCALVVAGSEWGRLAGMHGALRWIYAGVLGVAALTLLLLEHRGTFAQSFLHSSTGRFLYVLDVVFWIAIVPVWLYLRRNVRAPLLLGLVGALVLLPFWHALVWLQHTPGRLLAVLALVWIADTCAYFAGRAFGRHKLAPQISPGKTWEGVAGALAGVAACWWILSAATPASGPLPVSLIAALALVMISILGDLFESWLKRMAGQKDSGKLLPGHGGLLDRIDALTPTLPLAALYFAYPALRM